MNKKLNEMQEQAVHFIEGPCLVLAPPGSGKTYVIINRLLYLITEQHIDTSDILVITFTRAAASEMKERFIKLLSEKGLSTTALPTFGTFHSVFFEILKENFAYTSKSLIDDEEEKRILFKVLEREKDFNVTSDILSNILKDIKNFKMSLEREETYIPRYISGKFFKKIYNEYQDMLFNEKKLDFFDMIDKCRELLSKHEDILKIYNDKYKYILIDEFQDINRSQYDLIKLICKTKNLFVVGDDDQSIYRFRGSRPKVMKDFLRDYKGAKIIHLDTNYRCAKVITKFSKQVIAYNFDRFDKNTKSGRDDVGKLEIKAFVDSVEEDDYIIKKINEYKKHGIDYSDMAILYRTNLLANSTRVSLNKNNIPYRMKGESINIYDNFAVRDIISYLKLSINENDIESLINIANKPLRYISRDSIGYKNASLTRLIEYYQNKDFMLKYITKFRHNLHTIKNSITALAIHYIRTEVGYDDYLKKYCEDKDMDYEEIESILDDFEEESIGHNDISGYLRHIDSISKKDEKNIVNDDKEKDAVSLMTFHLSKGLEYKVVFIIDANDGLIPHKKSIKENDIETERRLFYVGMTRAKDYLHILFTTRRFGKNYEASRFIKEVIGG